MLLFYAYMYVSFQLEFPFYDLYHKRKGNKDRNERKMKQKIGFLFQLN